MDNKSMAILGMVLSIVVGPIGIIFSAIALNKFKQSGEPNPDGKGFAIAGLIIGIIELVIYIGIFACVGCATCLALGSGGSV